MRSDSYLSKLITVFTEWTFLGNTIVFLVEKKKNPTADTFANKAHTAPSLSEMV